MRRVPCKRLLGRLPNDRDPDDVRRKPSRVALHEEREVLLVVVRFLRALQPNGCSSQNISTKDGCVNIQGIVKHIVVKNVGRCSRLDKKNPTKPKLWMLRPALMQQRTPIEIACFAGKCGLTASEIFWCYLLFKPCNVL